MKHTRELQLQDQVLGAWQSEAHVSVLADVEVQGRSWPIYGLVIGDPAPTKPTLGLFAGVHGLERVGSHVALAFLQNLREQWQWDEDLRARFEHVRLVCIPIVNPGGMYLGWRSNPRGVDLMRNAPVEALQKPLFMVGGQRYSSFFPYYRGSEGAGFEAETQVLNQFVRKHLFPAPAALALDLHSGFGLRDRLWYPYAKSRAEFPRLGHVHALEHLLNRSFPHHVYAIEPQAKVYTTHGDMWDYLFDEHAREYGGNAPLFLPWTLEMGSWNWVKKNPWQLFSLLGVYNPVKEHRLRRVLRRHLHLLDFFLRAVRNYKAWQP